jgi:coenzyme F420-reducing hydrogenase alpha subunit
MRYLKLFEDHKETSDKIEEIEKEASDKITKIEKEARYKKEETLNQYKLLIDDMMHDITDDYKTTSVINISEIDTFNNRYVKTYIDYDITFHVDKYEDLINTLQEVVNRLKDAYGIEHNFVGIYNSFGEDFKIGNPARYFTPYDFELAKDIIKKYIEDNSGYDSNLKIKISF